VVDAHDDPECIVTAAIAAVTGVLSMGAVLVMGAIARPRPRRLPPARAEEPGRSRPRRRTLTILTIAFVAGGAVAAMGAMPVLVTAAACWLVRLRRRRSSAIATQRAIEVAMPDAVELLVLCVRAGCSPTQAVVELVARAPPPLRPAFAAVELRLHRGQGLADAVGALAEHAGPTGRDVARAIAIADRDGLPMAPVLDRLVAESRATRRRLGEAAARRLPVRLTFPLVTCTLPSFVLLAIAPAVLGALSTLRAHAP
jgi:Flp pilus assembly protein TadB